MNIHYITTPTIIKIGQTSVDKEGLEKFYSFISAESAEEPKLLRKLLDSDIADTDMISEIAGRVCYQSYWSGRGSEEYFDNILEEKHGNILEHSTINCFVAGVSRSLTHELIRHKVGTAISEMSQRFVGGNEKSGQWNIVVPAALRGHDYSWIEADVQSQIEAYLSAQKRLREIYSTKYSGRELTKIVNEAAREFLPNMVETRCVWTFNTRIVRHILDKRSSTHADKQIREFSQELWSLLEAINLLSMKDGSLDSEGQVVFKNTGV